MFFFSCCGDHRDLHSFPYTTLFRSINSDGSIQRVNLFARTLDIKFPTGISSVSDMAVMPGNPQTIAATVYKTLDRKSTRLNSSHLGISYAVFCLKKKKNT